jgi:hypothetical protein
VCRMASKYRGLLSCHWPGSRPWTSAATGSGTSSLDVHTIKHIF